MGGKFIEWNLNKQPVNAKNFIDSAEDREYWRALVSTVLNFRVSWTMELFIIEIHWERTYAELSVAEFEKPCLAINQWLSEKLDVGSQKALREDDVHFYTTSRHWPPDANQCRLVRQKNVDRLGSAAKEYDLFQVGGPTCWGRDRNATRGRQRKQIARVVQTTASARSAASQ